MVHEYRFRRFPRWVRYIGYIASLLSIGILACLWMAHVNYSAFTHRQFVILVFLFIGVALEGVFVSLHISRISEARIVIEDERMIYMSRRVKKEIIISNITQLRIVSVAYVGGWIEIISGKEKIRLSLALENIAGFVQDLKTCLDLHGLSDRYDEGKLFRFLKTAISSEYGWARLHLILRKILFAMFMSGAFGFIFSALGGGRWVFWVVLSALWPYLVYLLTEILFERRFSKGCTKPFNFPVRDIDYETRIYKKAWNRGTIIYLGMSLFIFGIALFVRR